MASVFGHSSYRGFLTERLGQQKGELQRIARAAKMNPSTLSQVLGGAREFTPEQALGVASYFGLPKQQAYYFLLLVQLERAGTPELRAMFREQLEALRKEEDQLVRRLPVERKLALEEQAIFYS